MSDHVTSVSVDTEEKVRVWDLPTRIFHWTLVATILFGWISIEFNEALNDPGLVYHRYNGYLAFVLILWRVLWGLGGPDSARFIRFVRGPKTVLTYTASLFSGREAHYLGHNPLGALGVLALLAAVAMQSGLGLFTEEHNLTMWGPLADLLSEDMKKTVREWHEEFFNVLIALIVAHVLAAFYHVIFKRDPIVRAMVTGKKPAGAYVDRDEITPASPLTAGVWALVLLGIAVGVFWGGITILGGKVIY